MDSEQIYHALRELAERMAADGVPDEADELLDATAYEDFVKAETV